MAKNSNTNFDPENLFSIVVELQETFIRSVANIESQISKSNVGLSDKVNKLISKTESASLVGARGINVDKGGIFWMVPSGDEESVLKTMDDLSSSMYEVLQPGKTLQAVFRMTEEGIYEASVGDEYAIRLVPLSEYGDYLDMAPLWIKKAIEEGSEKYAFVLFKKDGYGGFDPVMSLGVAPESVLKGIDNNKVVYFKTTKSLYAGTNSRYYIDGKGGKRVSLKLSDLRRSIEDSKGTIKVSRPLIFYGDKLVGGKSILNVLYPFLKPGTPFIIMAKGDKNNSADDILTTAYKLFEKPYWDGADIDSFDSIVDRITVRLLTTEIDLYDLADFVAKNISAREKLSLKRERGERLYKIFLYNRIFNAENIESTVIYKIYELINAAKKNSKVANALKEAGVDNAIYSSEANDYLDHVALKIEMSKALGRGRIAFDTEPLMYMFQTIYKAIKSDEEALAEWDKLREELSLETTVRLNISPDPFTESGKRRAANSIAAPALSFLDDVSVLRESSIGVPAISMELGDKVESVDMTEKVTADESEGGDVSSDDAEKDTEEEDIDLIFDVDLGNDDDEEGDTREVASGEVSFKDSVARVAYLVKKAFGGNVDVAFEGDLIEAEVEGQMKLAYGLAKPLMIRLATQGGQASTKVAVHEMVHELKYFLPTQEYEQFIQKARRDLVKSGRVDRNLPLEEVEEQLALWTEEYVERFENDIIFGRYYEIRDRLPSILRPVFDVMVAAYYRFLRLFRLIDRNVAVDTVYRLYTGEFSNMDPSADEIAGTPEENTRLAEKSVYSKLSNIHNVLLSLAGNVDLAEFGDKMLSSIKEGSLIKFKKSVLSSYTPGSGVILSSYLISKQPGYKGDRNLDKSLNAILGVIPIINSKNKSKSEKRAILENVVNEIYENVKSGVPSYLPKMIYLSSFEGDNIYQAYGVKDGDDESLIDRMYEQKENFGLTTYLISRSLFGDNAYYYDANSGRSYNVFAAGMFLNAMAIDNEEYFRDMLKMPGMTQVYKIFLKEASTLLPNDDSELYERVEEIDEKGNKVTKLVLKSNQSVTFSDEDVSDVFDSIETLLEELEDEEATSWRDIDEKKTFSLSEALRMAIEGLIKPDLKSGDLDDFFKDKGVYEPDTSRTIDWVRDNQYSNRFVKGESLIRAIQAFVEQGADLKEVLNFVDDVLSKAKNRVNYIKQVSADNVPSAKLVTLDYTNNPYVDFYRKGVSFIEKPNSTQSAAIHYAGSNIDFYARALQDVINYAHDYIEMNRAAGEEITPEIYDKAFQYGALIVGSTRPDLYALVYAFYNQYILPAYQNTPFFGAFDKDPSESALSSLLPPLKKAFKLLGVDKDGRDYIAKLEQAFSEYRKKTEKEFNKRVFILQKIITTLFNYVKYDSVSVSLSNTIKRSDTDTGQLVKDIDTVVNVSTSFTEDILNTLFNFFFIKKGEFEGYLSNLDKLKSVKEYYTPNVGALASLFDKSSKTHYLSYLSYNDKKVTLQLGQKSIAPFEKDMLNAIKHLAKAGAKKIDLIDAAELSDIKAIDRKYHFVSDAGVSNGLFVWEVLDSHVFHASKNIYNSKTGEFKDGVIGTLFSVHGYSYAVIKAGEEFFFLSLNGHYNGYSVISDSVIESLSKYAEENNIEVLKKYLKDELKDLVNEEYNKAITDIYNNVSSYITLTGDTERDVLLTIKTALTVAANTSSPLYMFFEHRASDVDDLREYVIKTVGLNELSLRSRNMLLSNSIQKINERGAGVKRKALYSQHSIAHNISRLYAYGIGPRLFKYVPELKGITRKTPDGMLHPVIGSNRFRGDAAVITKVKSIVDGKDHDVTDLYPADYALLSYMGVMTFPAVGRNTYLYLNSTTGYDAPENYKLRRDYFKAVVHEILNMLLVNKELGDKIKKVVGNSFDLERLASGPYYEDVAAKIEVINRFFDTLEGEEGVVALRKAGLVEKLAYEVKNGKISLPAQLVAEATKTETEITLSLLRSAIKDLDMYRTMMRSESPEGTGVVSDIYARKGYKMKGDNYYAMMTIEADIYESMIKYIETGDTTRLGWYFGKVNKVKANTPEERAAVVRRLAGITREERKDMGLKEGEMPVLNTPSLPKRNLDIWRWEGIGGAVFLNRVSRSIIKPVEDMTGVNIESELERYRSERLTNKESDRKHTSIERLGVTISIIDGLLSLGGIDPKPLYELISKQVERISKHAEGGDILVDLDEYLFVGGHFNDLLKKAYPELGSKSLKYPDSLERLSERVEFAREVIATFAPLMKEGRARDISALIDKPFGNSNIASINFNIRHIGARDYEKKIDIAERLSNKFVTELKRYIISKRPDFLRGVSLAKYGNAGYVPRGELMDILENEKDGRWREMPFKEEIDTILYAFIPSKAGIESIVKAINEGKSESHLWKLYTEDTGISLKKGMKEDLMESYPISKLIDKDGNINMGMLSNLFELLLLTAGDYNLSPFSFTPTFYTKFPNLKSRFFTLFMLRNAPSNAKFEVKGAPYSITGEEEVTLRREQEVKYFKTGYAGKLDLGTLQALHNELNFFHTAVAFMGNPLAYKNVETMVKRYVAVQTGRTLPVMNKYYQPPAKWRFIITKDKTIKDFFKGAEALAEGNDYMSSLANGYNQLLHLSEIGVVGDPETPVDDGGGFMLPYVASPILGYDRYEPGPYKDAFSKTDSGLGGKTVFLKHAHFPLPPGFAYNGSERLFAIFDRLFETDDGALKKEVSDLMKSLYDEGMERYKNKNLAAVHMLDRMRDKDTQDEMAEIVRRHMPRLKYLGIMPESASKNSKDYVAVDVDKLAEDKDLDAKGVPADVTGYGMVTYLFQKLGNIRIKSPSQHRNVFQGSGVNAKLFDRISEVFSLIIENNLSAISDVLASEIARNMEALKDGSDTQLVSELKSMVEALKSADEVNRADVVLETLNKLYMTMSLADEDVVTIRNEFVGKEYKKPLRRFIQDIITYTIRHSVRGLDGSAALLDILKKPDNIAFPSLIETVHEGLSRMFASKSRSVRGNRLIIQGASHIAEVVEVEIEHKQGDKVRYEYRLMSKQEAVKQGFLSANVVFGKGLPKVTYTPKEEDGVRVVIRPIRAHMFVKEDPDTGKRSFLSDEEINKINELYNAHYRRGEYSAYSGKLRELEQYFKENNIKVLHGEVVVGNVFMDNFALRPGMSISDYDSGYARAVHVLEEADLLSQYKLMKEMSLEEFINLPDVRAAKLKNMVREGSDEPVRVEDMFMKDGSGRLLPKLVDLSKAKLMVRLKKEVSSGKGDNMVVEKRETSSSQKVASARFLLRTDGKGMSEEEMLAYSKQNDKKVLSGDERAKFIEMPDLMSADSYFSLVSAATRRSFDKAMSTLIATRIPVSNINAIRGLRIVAFEDIGNVAFVPSEYLFIAGEDSDGDAYTTEMLETKHLIVEPSMQNKKVQEMAEILYSPLNLISTYRELSIDGTIKRFSLVYDKVYGAEEAEQDISDRVSLAGMTSRAVTASIAQKLIGLTVKGNEGINLLKASLLNLKKRFDIDDTTFDELVRRLTGLSDRYNGKFNSGFGFVHYGRDENGNLSEDSTYVRAFNPEYIHLYKESASYLVYSKDGSSIEGGDTINEAIEVFLNIALDANKYDLSKLNLSAHTGQYINTLLMMGVAVDDIIRFNLHPMMMVIRQVLESSESRNVESELLAEEEGGGFNPTYEDLKRAAVSMMASSNHPLMKEIRKKIEAAKAEGIAPLPLATRGQETTETKGSDKSIAELLADYIIDFYATLGDLAYGQEKEKDGKTIYVYDRSVPSRDTLVKEISRSLSKKGDKLTLADIERVLAFQLNDNFRKVFDFWGLVVDMKQKVSGVMAVLEIFKEKSANYHKFSLQMTKVLNNIFRTDEERRFIQLNLLRLLSEDDIVGALERIDDKDMAKVMVLGNPQMRSELRAMLMEHYVTAMLSPAMNSELHHMLMRLFSIYGVSNTTKTKRLSSAINNLLKYEYTINVYGNGNYRETIIDYVKSQADAAVNTEDKVALSNLAVALEKIDAEISRSYDRGRNPEDKILAFVFTLGREFTPLLARIAGPRLDGWGLYIDNRGEMPVLRTSKSDSQMDASAIMARNQAIARMVVGNPLLHLAAHAHAAILDDNLSSRSIISFMPQVLSVMPPGLGHLSFSRMVTNLDTYKHLQEISLLPPDTLRFTTKDGQVKYYNKLHSAHDILNVLNMLSMDVVQGADGRYTVEGLVPAAVIRPYVAGNTIRIGYDSQLSVDMYSSNRMVSKTFLVEGKTHFISDFARPGYHSKTFVIASQLGIPAGENAKGDWGTRIKDIGPIFRRSGYTSLLVMERRASSVINPAFALTVDGPQVALSEYEGKKWRGGVDIPVGKIRKEIMSYLQSLRTSESEDPVQSYRTFLRDKVKEMLTGKDPYEETLTLAKEMHASFKKFVTEAKKLIDDTSKDALDRYLKKQSDFIEMLNSGKDKVVKAYNEIDKIIDSKGIEPGDGYLNALEALRSVIERFDDEKALYLKEMINEAEEDGNDEVSYEDGYKDIRNFDDLISKMEDLNDMRQSLLDIITERPRVMLYSSIGKRLNQDQDEELATNFQILISRRDTNGKLLLPDRDMAVHVLAAIGGAIDYHPDKNDAYVSFTHPKVKSVIYDAVMLSNKAIDNQNKPLFKRVDEEVLAAVDVDNKLVNKVIEFITKRLGIPVEIINDPDEKFIGMVEARGVTVLNMAYITPDTPLREVVSYLFHAILKKYKFE